MNDLARRLAQAGRRLAVTDLDLLAGEARLLRDLERRRRVRVGAVVLGALVLVGGAGLLWQTDGPSPVVATAPATPRTVTFDDGSRVTLIQGATLQTVSAAGGADIVLRLDTGTAQFEVTKRAGRVFRVLAGTVTVDVVGTSFTVERVAEGARVTVQHGRVKVAWSDGQRYLDASDSGRFPPAAHVEDEVLAPAGGPATEIRPLPARPREGPTATTAAAAAAAAATTTPKPGWRALARSGQHARAYEALGKAGPLAVKDEPGDLLAAADVARLSGHPAEARAPLRQILDRHRTDPRAGLAAFTLGRVLLEEIHDPRGAAEAFALARAFEPDSPLVEDAWVHEIESLVRAGAAADAKSRAVDYLRKFPAGAKARQVRSLVGLK